MALIARARQGATSLNRPSVSVDASIVMTSVAIAAFGVLMVYSATRGVDLDPNTSFLRRQSLFVVAGVALMAVLARIDYRVWRTGSLAVYLVSVASLGLVLSPLGVEANGTQGWFEVAGFRLQPSEFSKVAMIILVAAFGSQGREGLSGVRLTATLGFAAVPLFLILRQPDAGTAMVGGVVVMGMLLVAGARARHLAMIVGVGVLGIGLILGSGELEKYQEERLTSFLNPDADGQDSGWNQGQAQIAIGQGGITGLGLFEGTQTKGAFVPEQQTDFIFTVVGEEFGFLGGSVLLGLFALLLVRIWRTAQVARDSFGMLICVGVFCMVLFQVFQSIGMTMGLMPITGIPLPLFSYGGSSMVTTFAGLGLVLSVSRHRNTGRAPLGGFR